MPSIYSTYYLNGVIRNIPELPTFYLNNFFKKEVFHKTQEVYFDIEEELPRISPFVHPKHRGELVENSGYQTKSFRPAYIKDKRHFDPDQPLERIAGEAIGGELTPMTRHKLALAKALSDQKKMLYRRLEIMAIETCLNGKITITGPGFPEVELDFGRHEDLTKTLANKDSWTNKDLDIVGQIEDFAELIREHSNGANVTHVVMSSSAWKLLRQNKQVKELLDIRRGGNSNLDLAPQQPIEGLSYKGNLGDFKIYTYTGSYRTASGDLTSYIPENTVNLISDGIKGFRHFGAIQDLSAELKSLPYFVKSWEEKDPSGINLLLQSAPLLVPYVPNASMTLKVA